MSLKDFDAKQFLLEKGEQVGLGIAVTLMVVMLVVSLFLPSRGFMSGSPVAKAQPLVDGSKTLETALRTRDLPDAEKPPKPEERLIDLETKPLRPDLYATGAWFEPTAPENPARRPPSILTLVEAAAEFAQVPIDTYIFDKNFTQVWVLNDPKNPGGANNAPGGKNNLASQYKGVSAMAGGARGGGKGGGRFAPAPGLKDIVAGDEKKEYNAKMTPIDKLTGSEHLARQRLPARMVLIEGSFPYKEQLKEFRRKLHLDSIRDVLDETVDEDKDKKDSKLYAFRFLGVEVERMEVDGNDKPVGKWTKLKLREQYIPWLMNSGQPFEPEDPKYDSVKPLDGLVMPLLREFHEEGPQNQMGMMAPGGTRRQGASRADEQTKTAETNYPEKKLIDKLKSIQSTLAKMAEVDPTKVATQTNSKFRAHERFNPFSANTSAFEGEQVGSAANTGLRGQQGEQGTEIEVPEYCLVRLVDIDNVEPGKSYRYRIKVRMANPNYNRDDVASAAYKLEKELESRDWFELKQTVHVPPETIYYVVDEKELNKRNKGETPAKLSLLDDMWKYEPTPREHYVFFQFHRWLESAVIGDTKTPIGDWTVAERVPVARGEAIGRTVKVDLPVWKYTRDAYILPAEDQSRTDKKRGRTCVNVNFGEESPEKETLLLDFEGGKESIRGPGITDTSAIEVLMLSPNGKLLARNSAMDGADEGRKKRRLKVYEHIKAVRAGKASNAGGPASGGGLDK